MVTHLTLIIEGSKGVIGISVPCYLNSLADVNELINELVKAKNQAFPSGYEDNKRQMEKLALEANEREFDHNWDPAEELAGIPEPDGYINEDGDWIAYPWGEDE